MLGALCLVLGGLWVHPVRLVLVLSIAVLVLDRLCRRGLRSLDQPGQNRDSRDERDRSLFAVTKSEVGGRKSEGGRRKAEGGVAWNNEPLTKG